MDARKAVTGISLNSLRADAPDYPQLSSEAVPLTLFVRVSQLSTHNVSSWTHQLLATAMVCLASLCVTSYDVLMRLAMPSWYLLDLDHFSTCSAYLLARAEKKTRRYVESASTRFHAAITSQQIQLNQKACLEAADFRFACHVFCNKHGKPWLLYASWRAFMAVIALAPGCALFSTVTDCITGEVLAVFVDFRQGRAVHHFITALVDHDASKRYGIYVAKYAQLISACTQDGVALLRCGPTTDDLKAGLGGLRLPVFVVGSPVWGRLAGRCSVVSFGVFTTLATFIYLWLTQWQMDASGMGRLAPSEFLLMYACCITFVKLLPLHSIGWQKVLAEPMKYLVQTSFYAQGAIFGGALFIALDAYWRKTSPLQLLDAVALFVMAGEMVGRLGCHYYGCCFGRPLAPPAQPPSLSCTTPAPHPDKSKAAQPTPSPSAPLAGKVTAVTPIPPVAVAVTPSASAITALTHAVTAAAAAAPPPASLSLQPAPQRPVDARAIIITSSSSSSRNHNHVLAPPLPATPWLGGGQFEKLGGMQFGRVSCQDSQLGLSPASSVTGASPASSVAGGASPPGSIAGGSWSDSPPPSRRSSSHTAGGDEMQAKQEMQGKVAAVAAVATAAAREGGGGSSGHSWRDVPFNPWTVMYLDKASSVSRLRPEYRLLPLLPTQLGQAVYAGLVQCALLACLLLNPVVKTGIVGCAVLAAYSVGRILFFMLREDEKFKSNRSYTTAYVALITIGLSAVTALYAQLASPHSSRFALTHLPSAEDCHSYAWVAAATSAINFLIQGLHHHEQVGRFPDLTALFGPPVPAMRAPGSKQQLWSSWGELPKGTKTKAS